MKTEKQMESARKNLVKIPKGTSGNPNGRPKIPVEVKEAAKAHTMDMLGVLLEVALHGKNEASRVNAATAVLNRGWGQPKQTVDVDVNHTQDWTSLLAALDQRNAALAAQSVPMIIDAEVVEHTNS